MKYSEKEKLKVVKMYYKTGSIKKAIKILGYPKTRNMVYNWIEEYEKTGTIKDGRKGRECRVYSDEERKAAIEFYYSYGKGYRETVKKLGYPSSNQLKLWVLEEKEQKSTCLETEKMIQCSKEDIIKAATEYCSQKESIGKISTRYNVPISQIYECASVLLNKEFEEAMKNRKNKQTNVTVGEYESIEKIVQEKQALEKERLILQQEIELLRMERDALEAAGKLLKKYMGINLKEMSNREKAIVIDALNKKYSLCKLLKMLDIAKSSYFYQLNAIKKPNKNDFIREEVKTEFENNKKRYGYRRIHAVLRGKGIIVSEKRVRQVMREEHLVVYRKSSKKYSSYQGEITPAVENIINRDFHADAPNQKWLTDITEFSLPAGKVYLSPIIDCFDGMPISWTIGISPNAALVNEMLDLAFSTLSDDEHPIVHSDRGSHYRWQGWIDRMDNYNLTRSMSKKGCSPDNSACEGFFGTIKNEMFYCQSWENVQIDEFITILNDYLNWFQSKRIKKKLGFMSPIDYRKHCGLQFNNPMS